MLLRDAFVLIGKAAALSVVTLCAWEGFWLGLGFQPSVRDDPGLWASWRRQANGGRDIAVLLGTSRTHLDLDPAVLGREIRGYRFVQLAVNGNSPLPMLEDLAGDAAFRGVVLCEFMPWMMFEPYDPKAYPEASRLLQFYRNETWGTTVETGLRIELESRFRFARQDANLWTFGERAWDKGRIDWDAPHSMRRDRRESLDYSRVDHEKAVEDWVRRWLSGKKALEATETSETMRRVAGWTAAIERRGGKVVFMRLVVTGRLRQVEDELYPRQKYWDVFARSQKSLSLSFEDYPALRGFDCPDGSHLDFRDVKRFSVAFARVLQDAGTLSANGPQIGTAVPQLP